MSESSRGFGYWLNIFANLAVVAGIVFLVVEIRQNNELLEVQTQADLFDRSSGFAEEVIRTPQLAAAFSKVEGGEPLTPEEEMLVRAMALKAFRLLEFQFRELQAGRLPRVELTTWRTGFQSQGIFRWPLGEYWGQMKPFFSADFVRFVEDSVVAR